MTENEKRRVGTIYDKNERDNKVFTFGFGNLVGNVVPEKVHCDMYKDKLKLIHQLNAHRISIPKIELDNGKVVYECECLWDLEEKVKDQFKGMEVIELDIDKIRGR